MSIDRGADGAGSRVPAAHSHSYTPPPRHDTKLLQCSQACSAGFCPHPVCRRPSPPLRTSVTIAVFPSCSVTGQNSVTRMTCGRAALSLPPLQTT
ncbi:hypothetical protein ACOMHN_052730 [Nucella lapillus]